MSADYFVGAAAPSAGFGGTVNLNQRKDTPADLSGGTDATLTAGQVNSAGNLRVTTDGGLATYFHNSQFSPDTTGTNVWNLPGVANKTLKVKWIRFSAVATAAASGRVTVRRQSAADTAGTPANATITKATTGAATAAAQAVHYTAHPTAIGAGTALDSRQYGQAAVNGVPQEILFDFRGRTGEQEVRLSGTTDILALNMAAALCAAGTVVDITACVTEEPTTA